MPEGSMIGNIGEWLGAGKSAVEILKSARDLIPKGEKRDEVDRKLQEAEQVLARSDAKLAHDLGYTMCKCTFPPTAMLFKRDQCANVCPNCGESERVWKPEDLETTADMDYDPFRSYNGN